MAAVSLVPSDEPRENLHPAASDSYGNSTHFPKGRVKGVGRGGARRGETDEREREREREKGGDLRGLSLIHI